MTQEEINRLVKEVTDLQKLLRSVDRKVATLPQINEKVTELKSDVIALRKRYSDEVTPNIKMWNQAVSNQNKLTWLIVAGFVASIMAFLGLN